MNPYSPSCLSRRDFLWRFGGGLGGVALAHLLGQHGLLAADETGSLAPSVSALTGVLRNGAHHPARARRVIQLFMNGGASQMDLFDYKPELLRRHGQKFDPGGKVELFQSDPGEVMKSPWDWKQHGQCGKWISDLVPHIASCADDLAFKCNRNPALQRCRAGQSQRRHAAIANLIFKDLARSTEDRSGARFADADFHTRHLRIVEALQ